MGAQAGSDAERHQNEGQRLHRRRQASLPTKAVDQGEQGLEQDHLADQGQRQQPAHPVPQVVADDRGQHGHADRNPRQPHPVRRLMLRARSGQQGDRQKQQALRPGDDAGQQIPVVGGHRLQLAKPPCVLNREKGP
ncbi:hypothetical protein D3C73_851460 [compost metagenome]